jgi:tetratricopeptide (TPR) repeat protein
VYYRGTLAYQQGDVELAQRLGEEAVALADSSANPEARCIAHNLCGTVANMTAQFDVAEDHLRLALTAARENAAPSMVAGMLCSLAVPLYYRGEFAEAQALTREAAATFEALGRMPTAGLLRGNLAGQLLASGDSAAAKTEALISIRMTRDAGDDDALSASLATLADVLLATGELHGARAALDEALALARAMQRPLIITECLFLLATIALREHRHEESLEHLRALRATLHKDRLAVRVPMLILGVADWAATGARANLRLAQRWLDALARLPDIDRSLALKARASLDALGDDANARGGEVSLADLEREVGEFLDRL